MFFVDACAVVPMLPPPVREFTLLSESILLGEGEA